MKPSEHALHVTSVSEVSYTTRMNSAKASAIADLITKYEFVKPKNFVSKEFQDYGYRLASDLGDLKRKSLYIKLARDVPRGLLEQARSYVIDAENAKNKARLFMWKLKQLREAYAKREQAKKHESQ